MEIDERNDDVITKSHIVWYVYEEHFTLICQEISYLSSDPQRQVSIALYCITRLRLVLTQNYIISPCAIFDEFGYVH